MSLIVETEDGPIELDSDILFSGEKEYLYEERAYRKLFRLPLTKQLVYYTNKSDYRSAVNVNSFRIVQAYNKTSLWCTMQLFCEDGRQVLIHSRYFAHMQEPSFISDLREMEKSLPFDYRTMRREA